MAAGAITGAMGFASLFSIARPMGIVDTGAIQGYLPVLGMSLLSGGLWGAFVGTLPGLLIGPGLSFSFDYSKGVETIGHLHRAG
jgi:hypothetical protein